MKNIAFLSILVILFSCSANKDQTDQEQLPLVQVELVTTKGKVIIELSNKTPKHRDNFIKIVNEGRLDSMLFHRVINDFVVQAGLYDSLKTAQMDSIDYAALNYTIPAEFDTSLFHKRGVVGAARTDNPERASSPLSFAIVQRGPRSDSLLAVDEKRINGWLQKNSFINDPANKVWKDSIQKVEEEGVDYELYSHLQDTVNKMAKSYPYTSYVIPEHHKEVYRTIGGNAHLDQNYTIFGEVIQGMDIIDSIAIVPVNENDRPLENIYILRARVMK